jgi:hypothetical protein
LEVQSSGCHPRRAIEQHDIDTGAPIGLPRTQHAEARHGAHWAAVKYDLPIFTGLNLVDCGILTNFLLVKLRGEITMSKMMQAAIVEHCGIDGRIVLHMT